MRKAGIALVVALFIGAGASAVGPAWTVDDVHGTYVTCHEKFHAEHTKQVTIPATSTPEHGDACPGQPK